MSDDVLVRVENVSKRFCRSLKRSLWYGLQDLGSEISGRRHGGGCGLPQSSTDVHLRPDEFWAVQDVSFELRRGECLGLMGRNGAGKTTLLRMLNGLIKPDTGRIEMKGRVGALIALGAGFNPVLSGRENIYTNASVLGLNKIEINEKIEDIIDFSEIEEFLDSPVQTYSSGMQVRLGFAIATALNPDILILDEVLAVGDERFRAKCLKRIDAIRERTATIFVSHDTGQIRHICDKGICLSKGQSFGVEAIEKALKNYSLSSTNLTAHIKGFVEMDTECIGSPDIQASVNVEGGSCSFCVQFKSPIAKHITLLEVRIAIVSNEKIVHVLRSINQHHSLRNDSKLTLNGVVCDLTGGEYQANLYISRVSKSETGTMLIHATNIFEFTITESDIVGYGCSHVSPLKIKTQSTQGVGK